VTLPDVLRIMQSQQAMAQQANQQSLLRALEATNTMNARNNLRAIKAQQDRSFRKGATERATKAALDRIGV
jgi:hypothetical protein